MALELKPPTVRRHPRPRWGELGDRFSGRHRIVAKDRLFFTEQLALLLETGSALHAALKVVREQLQNPAMADLVDQLLTDIAEGKTFSYALSRHPRVFSQTYVNLIAASENGGFMHQILTQLLEMDEKREALRNSMISAFSYPLFLLVFALGVVIFVLVVVFPKFGSLFSAIRDELPATTLILMAVSDFLRLHWLALSGGIAAGALLIGYWIASAGGRKRLDRLKLGMPGLRGIFVKLYLIQSLRVMSLSLGNGVGIVATLDASQEVVRNARFRQFIGDVRAKVEAGAGIAPGFADARFIPRVVEHMIATGEQTGHLPKVMGRLADFYEQQLDKQLKMLSRLAEPVMLMVMGVVVGVLVSSLILPIFKLSRAIH